MRSILSISRLHGSVAPYRNRADRSIRIRIRKLDRGRRYAAPMEIRYVWRGYLTNKAVNQLHAAGFGHEPFDDDWESLLDRHSLGWVCAYEEEELVGFVNVAWDGAFHAFILDTLVSPRLQRRGIATQLVSTAADGARKAGCEWLHVDFDPELRGFYLEACGFQATEAGLIRL